MLRGFKKYFDAMLVKAAIFLVIVLASFYLVPKTLTWYFSIAIDKPSGNYDFIIGKLIKYEVACRYTKKFSFLPKLRRSDLNKQ